MLLLPLVHSYVGGSEPLPSSPWYEQMAILNEVLRFCYFTTEAYFKIGSTPRTCV